MEVDDHHMAQSSVLVFTRHLESYSPQTFMTICKHNAKLRALFSCYQMASVVNCSCHSRISLYMLECFMCHNNK